MESFYLWDINRGLEDLLNFGQQTTNNYPFFSTFNQNFQVYVQCMQLVVSLENKIKNCCHGYMDTLSTQNIYISHYTNNTISQNMKELLQTKVVEYKIIN